MEGREHTLSRKSANGPCTKRRYSGRGVRAKAAINFTFRASATIVSGGGEKVRVCGVKGLRLVRAARSEGRAMEDELHVRN